MTVKVKKPTTSLSQRLMWLGNTVFHQMVAVVGTFILWTVFYNLRPYDSYAIHTVLTTLAYVPLMAEAIVLFANDNVWTQNIPRTTKYIFHGVMLFISAILATIGIAFMIYRKNAHASQASAHSSSHFQSVHAITGLLSWIFVLLSQILGLASAKSHSLKNIFPPVWTKFIHNCFGILGYVLGMISLAYAMNKSVFRLNTSEEARNATMVILAFVAAWTLIAALKSAVEQLKGIVEGFNKKY